MSSASFELYIKNIAPVKKN